MDEVAKLSGQWDHLLPQSLTEKGIVMNQKIASNIMKRRYRLLGADGKTYESDSPGLLGGNKKLRIYGRLNCWSALLALPKGYAKHRVFFANEEVAIAAGYRPCGKCLKERYAIWKRGGVVGSAYYPWLVLPK